MSNYSWPYVAGTSSLRASFDWSRHHAIDLEAPPRTAAADPPVRVTAQLAADGSAVVVQLSVPDGRAIAFTSADEVAAAIAFLCSDDAAYITGEAVNVSGGQTMT